MGIHPQAATLGGALALRFPKLDHVALAVALFACGAASASAEDIAKSVAKGATAIAKGAANIAQQAVEAVTPPPAKPSRKKKSAKKLVPPEPKVAAPAAADKSAPPAAALATPTPGASKQGAPNKAAETLPAHDSPPSNPKASFPVTVPEAKVPEATIPEAKAEAEAKPPETWSPAEITDAKARCAAILKKISAIAIPEAPIKEGACGAPAPIQLISIGKTPEISISPPAIITCELAEALAAWIETDLQPLAKKHLGAEIIKIESMSSYSCRNAYGRTKNKLSEHGVANALDIRGFTTAAGKTALVLEDWGTPQREILARIAAQKAAAERAAAELAAAVKAAQSNQIANKALNTKAGANPATPPVTTGSTVGAPAAGIARSTIIDGIPKLTVTIPGASQSAKPGRGTDPAYSATEPDKLGGPKTIVKRVPGKTAALPDAATDSTTPTAIGHTPKAQFLHAAHTAACRIFGTTLGPEANGAHRNHFHVDMAARKTIKICD